jgi:flagellar motor switch protein FliG
MSSATIAGNQRAGLTQVQKAAILLITLPEDESVEILQTLEEDEIIAIARETVYLKHIPQELVNLVHEEFLDACRKRRTQLGGVDRFRRLVKDATGEMPTVSGEPGVFLSKLDPGLLANVLRDEHPQTVALILSSMGKPDKARTAIALLPERLQVDVIMRMATLGKVKSGTISQIEEVVREQIVTDSKGTRLKAGGIDMVAAALNHMERNAEEKILMSIEEADPELAEQIKAKMFTFEDLTKLNDQAIQLLIREINADDLALALRASSAELQEKIYQNMSSRAASILKENIESMGPTKLSDVQSAQTRIAMTAKRLGEEGKIMLIQDKEKYLKGGEK